MFSFGKKKASKTAGQGNELQKLRRQDLLELLLEQLSESDALRATLDAREATIAEQDALINRLKAKLDDKDALIEKLKHRLDLKDQMIADQLAQGHEVPASLTEMLAIEEHTFEALLAQQEEATTEFEAEPESTPAPEEVPDAH